MTTDSKGDEDCATGEVDGDQLFQGKDGDADVAVSYDSQVDEMLAQEA